MAKSFKSKANKSKIDKAAVDVVDPDAVEAEAEAGSRSTAEDTLVDSLHIDDVSDDEDGLDPASEGDDLDMDVVEYPVEPITAPEPIAEEKSFGVMSMVAGGVIGAALGFGRGHVFPALDWVVG